MTWRTLIAPEFTGDVGYLWRDTEEGADILTVQDVGAYLDRNKAMANHNDGYTPSRDMRRVADIPAIVIEKWLREEGLDVWNPEHNDRLARKLNDPDYAWLRTAPGRVAPTQDGSFR